MGVDGFSPLALTLPPGQLLEADRFDMSRLPLGESSIKLARDGHVVTLSNRSTIVGHQESTPSQILLRRSTSHGA